MNDIKNVLDKFDIKCISYKKIGKAVIINTKDNKYVIKKNKTDTYEYLKYRNFENYIHPTIYNEYEIRYYIDDIDVPREQKMIDLISIVSILHKKTTYYKKTNEFKIDDLYNKYIDLINDIKLFYDKLMDKVEQTTFFPPSYYYLARNISVIYNALDNSYKSLNNWYLRMKDIDRVRVSVIHGNLSLEHFIDYRIISWDNSCINMPIIDLYKLYKNTYNEYDWEELLKIYITKYKLKEEELYLLKVLISIPDKLELTSIEIDNIFEITKKLEYIKLTQDFTIKEVFIQKENKV